jgi:hypothetical protein
VTYSLPACPDFEIWLWDGGTGTITFTVDGGAPTSLPAGSGGTAATWSRVTVTGQASTTHSLVIAGAAGATAYVAGVQPASQDPGVRVNRMGRVGDTTANLVGLDSALNADAAGQVRQQTAYAKVGGPHLVVVGYGVNDYMGQNTTARDARSARHDAGAVPGEPASVLQRRGRFRGVRADLVRPTDPERPDPGDVSSLRVRGGSEERRDREPTMSRPSTWPTSRRTGRRHRRSGLQTQVSVNPTRRGHGLLARILHDVLAEQVVFG